MWIKNELEILTRKEKMSNWSLMMSGWHPRICPGTIHPTKAKIIIKLHSPRLTSHESVLIKMVVSIIVWVNYQGVWWWTSQVVWPIYYKLIKETRIWISETVMVITTWKKWKIFLWSITTVAIPKNTMRNLNYSISNIEINTFHNKSRAIQLHKGCRVQSQWLTWGI